MSSLVYSEGSVNMGRAAMMRKALYLVMVVIALSPLVYYATGIGQRAEGLSPALVVADGQLDNSPKAQALHRLILPIRIESLLVYPLFLFLMQASGLAVRFRKELRERVVASLMDRRGFKLLNRRLTRLTRMRLTLVDLTEISLYIALTTLFITCIYFPFSFYRGFILRHQFDLSTQTLAGWLRDFGLGEGINLLLSLVVYGGFYSLVKVMPRQWPIWLGAGFAVLLIGYYLLQPLLITPLFYEISPITDEGLQDRILRMADRAGMLVDDISVIDASSKTTTVNAYVTGFGRASKIVLWDTLLARHPPDEVDVVLAHEMGHWYYQHTLIWLLWSVAGTWLGLFALKFWLNRVWRGLGWRGPYDVASYPYLLALFALVGILTLPLTNTVSRFAENQADQFALEVSQRPAAAKRLFERFAEENLSLVRVPTWEKVIFYTHPPLNERLERAQAAIVRRP